MLAISFHRVSVCMGDDANNGKQYMGLPDDSTLEDLITAIRKGGSGNEWPIPYTGGNSHWIVNSNIGDLAHVSTDNDGEWHVEYFDFDERTPLRQLGIEWTFAGRPKRAE